MITDDVIQCQNSSVVGIFEFLINLALEVRLKVPDALLLLHPSLDFILDLWWQHVKALESVDHFIVDWRKFHYGTTMLLIFGLITNFNYRRLP